MVWTALEKVLDKGVAGHIVELGCYSGTTSLFIRRLLDQKQQSTLRQFHVYDSFEGLPSKTSADTSAAGVEFKAGELAVSRKQLVKNFERANLKPPIIHKGWFNDLTPSDMPSPISFAFLDGDFYESIIASLRLVVPAVSSGGVILVDDYQREALPGVERAINDYFRGKTLRLRHSHNIAIIEL